MDTLHQFPKRMHIKIIMKLAGEETIIHKTISLPFVRYGVKLVNLSEGTVTDCGRSVGEGMKRTDLRIGLQKIIQLGIFIIRIIHVLVV
jgi:hypothetical protein